MYYADKIEQLKDIFGTNQVTLEKNRLTIDGSCYPIIDDVIILLKEDQYPKYVKDTLQVDNIRECNSSITIAEDIQFTFGEEWKKFSSILPEHKKEFDQYFDIVDTDQLDQSRICDLGCGIGRWSYFLKDKCKELVLVDFSEAIFVARNNLRENGNAIFFMGDIMNLPFKEHFSDFIFCLGVLHHLPYDSLTQVRNIKKYAPMLLIYLYYSLDNRPYYYRVLLKIVSWIRASVSKVRNPFFRSSFTWIVTLAVYVPLVLLGKLVKPFGLSSNIPLYDGYFDKGIERIRQDVYDRFFVRIEQRVTKKEIMELENEFCSVLVSNKIPYWHFLCKS